MLEEDIQFICENHPLVFLDTKKPIGPWAENVTYIKINNDELNRAQKITKTIRNKLIVTLGPDGASHQGKIYPVETAEVKDLSGAGDTFLAALCTHYCATKNISDSIAYANECATQVVQRRGVSTI